MIFDDAATEQILPMSPASPPPREETGPQTAGTAVTFEELLTHHENVFRICLGFSRNYAEAEDLAQETYLKACRAFGTLGNPDLAKEWLFRIAKNTCLDQRKKVRLRRTLLFRWAARPEAEEPQEAPSPGERLQKLKSAVQELPPRLRETFVLREYGHLSYTEIAATLKIKEGSVMSRLNRARAAVGKRIQETGHVR
jgi:RNA polymerase sigma-70 factor (ECF subfamily)